MISFSDFYAHADPLLHIHNKQDYEEEIGKKALVSMILNGKRNLTKDHIAKLSARFNVSPALFF